jgi:hypothetical protein
LTIEEISYINGICPAIIIFTLPLSGHFYFQFFILNLVSKSTYL